ncbi:MAG: hypothetical protein RMJ39_10620 [Deltaproteobacteria bacterium]|nr:hypothetical protein [Deltaproteobacteria bacterium]
MEVISRTIDKYPDWKAVIPNLSSDDVSSFSVGCNALREALESALIVAEKDLPTCTFHIADDELTVLNESQKGRMIQKLKLTSRGLKKKTLVFNMNYLLQAFDTLSEPITFYYKGEKDPVAIVDSLYSEDCIPNYFHLIMPINPS